MSQLSHAEFPLRRHPDLLVDHRRARSAAVAEPRGANVESRDRLRWPASFRNGGRNQIGTVADIKSESPAGLPRNSQPRKPGNSGGGKGPQFKTDAARGEGHGDWETYQLRKVFRNCRWRRTRKTA